MQFDVVKKVVGVSLVAPLLVKTHKSTEFGTERAGDGWCEAGGYDAARKVRRKEGGADD